MISRLHGAVRKSDLPVVTVDVGGVGYEVQCTTGLWESLEEGGEGTLHIFTFVREDRLELFGFSTDVERKLFKSFLSIPGIGPRTALQLAGLPVDVLSHAVEHEDTRVLSSLKGIGKKMAEKLLVELQSLAEKGVLTRTAGAPGTMPAGVDEDALEALTKLGYERWTILKKLRELPKEVDTTEERVKKVLQVL